MNVERIEQQFHKLKEQWEAGNIDDEQFATELEKLQFQDGQGRLWGIEALTGQWYYEEEGCWVQDEPPRELKVPSKAATAKVSISPTMTLLARLPSLSLKAKAQVFLSYAREDRKKVENLYQKLSDAGFKPWMDTKDILPGEQWKSSIRKAVQRSDFFLACLSANSVNKRGWIQKEIKDALDIWQEKLEDDIYLIPVRLEDCEAPESLRDFQWVNLFEEDGWTQLVKAIQVGMKRRA